MSIKHTQDDGTEIEVFTSEEVAARETATRTAVEGEYKPKVDELNTKLTAAEQRALERSGEFQKFRELNAEQLAKLTETERTLYENQKLLTEERTKNAAADAKAYEGAVAAAIRAKVGNDATMFAKVSDMYKLINLEDITPEGIANRVSASLGALGATAPDLLATAGFSVGTVEPPKPKVKADETFADSERGRAGASELGLATTEEEAKKKLGIPVK